MFRQRDAFFFLWGSEEEGKGSKGKMAGDEGEVGVLQHVLFGMDGITLFLDFLSIGLLSILNGRQRVLAFRVPLCSRRDCVVRAGVGWYHRCTLARPLCNHRAWAQLARGRGEKESGLVVWEWAVGRPAMGSEGVQGGAGAQSLGSLADPSRARPREMRRWIAGSDAPATHHDAVAAPEEVTLKSEAVDGGLGRVQDGSPGHLGGRLRDVIGFHQTLAAGADGVLGTWEALATNRSCNLRYPGPSMSLSASFRSSSQCLQRASSARRASNQWMGCARSQPGSHAPHCSATPAPAARVSFPGNVFAPFAWYRFLGAGCCQALSVPCEVRDTETRRPHRAAQGYPVVISPHRKCCHFAEAQATGR